MKAWTHARGRMILGVLIGCVFALPANALAATGGDPNKGDVWVDTVGEPAGPGHEMDPHLPCADINLWGAKLDDSGDKYSIDGWEPSGSKGRAYSSTWSYDKAKGGTQIIDVIDVETLIRNAAANGDTPTAQGYHFKLQFSQDPQKHKTFWINCPPPSDTGQPGSTEQGGSTGGDQGTVQNDAGAGQQAVLGERVSGGSKRKARKHRAHRKHKKHHKTQRQLVLPAFTG